jgi:hypothetical protein
MAQITELTNDPNAASGDADDESVDDATATTPRGPLLDLPPKEAAKRVTSMRKSQDRARERRAAEAQRVVYWRKGYRFVRLSGDEDRGNWRAVLPMGASKMPPQPNKTDRLLRRIVSVVTNDKPVPDAQPADDSDEEIAAAEMTTRLLRVEGASARLNIPRLLRRVMDKSMTFKSGFVWFWVDPKGGGHRPKVALAHPNAVDVENAEKDPATGEVAKETELTERYVRADGTLSDDDGDASRQWLPRVKSRLLTPQHVDMLPESAESIDDANGVMIVVGMTIGTMKSQFAEEFAALTAEQLSRIVKYKPKDWELYLPRRTRQEWKEPTPKKDGTYEDDTLVFPTFTIFKQHEEYPVGAFVVTVGEELIYRDDWCADIELPDGTMKPEYLELPVAQCRCLDDDVDDDPMGIAVGERIGPMDEIRATTLSYSLDYLFRFGNPQVYLPIGTTVQPKQLTYRTGDPVYVQSGAQPFYETIPALPKEVNELRAEMGAEEDDESGLQQAAQGVEDPSVQSGIHAATIVEQSNIALSQVRENAGDCYKRMCMIVVQLWRCFYDVEQQLDYQSEDGSWKRDAWVGTDLGSTKAVEIARGSFTMLAPSSKQAMATQWFQMGLLPQDEYEAIMSSGMSTQLSYQDNPDRQRVMGQLAAWKQGPKDADVQAYQAYQEQLQQFQAQQQQLAAVAQQNPAVGMAMQDPAVVGAIAPQEPPPLVLPSDPFASDPRPCDNEKDAAMIRHRALRRVMATKAYGGQPQFWRDALAAEYERMRHAAGIQTVAEVAQAQQEAAAQAAAQQASAQAADVQKNGQNAAAKTAQTQSQLADKAQGRAADVEQQAREHAHESEMASRAAGAA